ncbi:ABC transporter permease [Pseudoneobacillus sp. C159]
MNIMNKVTIRHMRENKRRTLVTIIGVIISVAMVTAVATLGVSFLDLMKRQTIANYGEWHVQYKNVNKDQIDAIKNDEATKKIILANDRGYAKLEGLPENRPYLFIKEYNQAGLTSFPITLTKGRLPKNPNEILVSEEILRVTQKDYQLGGQLNLEIGNRYLNGTDIKTVLTQNEPLQRENGQITETFRIEDKKTFTIVGFIKMPSWEPPWSPGYTIVGFVDQSHHSPDNRMDAVVVLKKVDQSLYDHADNLVAQNRIEMVKFNSELLRYYGVTNNDGLRKTLFSLTAIIMTVIIIGSVALIYNAFAISVSERARHLGMLASVGATKMQKRNSVFFEGMIVGAISIPIGIAAGLIGIGVTFIFINHYIGGALGAFGTSERLEVIVTPYSIIVSSIVSVVTIFISTFIPARKASKISAIDAIRQTQDVKLSGKAVKTSKLIRKLFGIEAEIGLKNLKRHRKRYQATVFSLIISIVLFLSVSFFTSNLKKSLEMSQDGINYDIRIYSDGDINEDLYREVADLETVSEVSLNRRVYLNTWIEESLVPEKYKEEVRKQQISLKEGRYPFNIFFMVLDDSSFKKYAKQIGADFDNLSTSEPAAIVIDQIKYQEYDSRKFIETKTIHAKPGQSIDLYTIDSETSDDLLVGKMKIGYLTKQIPLGDFQSAPGVLMMIIPNSLLNSLPVLQKQDKMWNEALYLKSFDPMKTQEKLEAMNNPYISVNNLHQEKQNEEQLIMLMSVFTYGFIVLISLISVANIFNTISTSISLRKREFAMLRSIGMTPKGFNKMIHYESIFYGLKALLYGLPLSFGVMLLIYRSIGGTFEYGFTLPWLSIVYVIVAIFFIVASAMIYSSSKVKKENIIDALRQESI